MACDECGGTAFAPVETKSGRVFECELCGALSGDEAGVASLLLDREARDHGFDPQIYPLVRTLERLPGLHVIDSDAGDPQAGAWPFVQMASTGVDALLAIENLLKSLRLSGGALAVHWVVEAEFHNRLVFTLKPRFHRDLERITNQLVESARADLARLHACLERDMRLAWWRS